MKKIIKNIIPDAIFLRIMYKKVFGKKLNLKNPQTFNEKLQWLKLYDRKDIYTTMVDKYEVKEYVAKIIGDKYIIPTIGVYNKFDDIDFDELPNQFVIKCTHDSGGLVIVDDKKNFDIKNARKKINKSLKKNYYYNSREWPYKNVKPRIIVEKYMEDKKYKSMRDYKFFCFDGKPKLMYISEGSHTNDAKIAFYDMDFNKLDIKRKDYKDFEILPNKPLNFEKMKEIARVLSKGIPHLRVDLYDVNGKIYFGELTFSTCSGYIPFSDEKWDKKLGDMLDLTMVKKNEK